MKDSVVRTIKRTKTNSNKKTMTSISSKKGVAWEMANQENKTSLTRSNTKNNLKDSKIMKKRTKTKRKKRNKTSKKRGKKMITISR